MTRGLPASQATAALDFMQILFVVRVNGYNRGA
jgi:hypothetical protein